MKKLLLLDNRYTPDTQDIWKAAIKLGWATQRTDQLRVKQHIEGYDFIRYYGNTLHAAQIKDQLPINFIDLPQILDKYEFYTFTKRIIWRLPYNKFPQPLMYNWFVKPAREKWFEAKIYKRGEYLPENGCLPDDEIYMSQIVKFIDEVRCFCLDGEILTSSLYRINSIVWDATNENPEDINFDSRIKNTPIPQMVKEIAKFYPKGVVLDFGLLENGDWAFIEANEAYSSGIYYCLPEKCLDVIIASEENKVEVNITAL